MNSESSLDSILKECEKALLHPQIAPLFDSIRQLPIPESTEVSTGEYITFTSEYATPEELNALKNLAKKLKPWRKGPFDLFGLKIESEWNSAIKYDLIAPYLDITGKSVLDIGCNNGYYLFRMLEKNPLMLYGIDPSARYKTQFEFLNAYAGTSIRFDMLGIEHLSLMKEKFNTILCLGILYHRTDPIMALKSLTSVLERQGSVILDSLIIDGAEPMALVPDGRYAKMKNAYFIPTIPALESWLHRAKLSLTDIIGIVQTTTEEQRKTEWIEGESLESFLDPDDPEKTIEGYPAPKRVYIKAKKSS